MTATALKLTSMCRDELPYVVRTLRRLGVAPADVEDLAHDVFVVALKKEATRAAGVALKPWLFTIAQNLALHHFRRTRRSPEVPQAWPDAEDTAKGPEAAAVEAQQRRALMKALHALDEDQRAVFLLHDVDGCRAPEIAAALSVPLNTVYSRLRLARAHLVKEIAPMKEQEKDDALPPVLMAFIGFLQEAPAGTPEALEALAARIEGSWAKGATAKGVLAGVKLKLIAGGLLGVAVLAGWWLPRPPPCSDTELDGVAYFEGRRAGPCEVPSILASPTRVIPMQRGLLPGEAVTLDGGILQWGSPPAGLAVPSVATKVEPPEVQQQWQRRHPEAVIPSAPSRGTGRPVSPGNRAAMAPAPEPAPAREAQ